MATRTLLVALSAGLLAGCSSPSAPPLSMDHPANPEAMAAPMRERSMTLALDEPVGSGSSDAMPGMQHDMAGMKDGSGKMDRGTPGAETAQPSGQQGGHEGHGSATTGAPAAAEQTPATQPDSGQALYACPMHKEVTSTNPNERCPKCKMKINKPVKKAAAPGAPPAAPTSGKTDHSEHGGH